MRRNGERVWVYGCEYCVCMCAPLTRDDRRNPDVELPKPKPAVTGGLSRSSTPDGSAASRVLAEAKSGGGGSLGRKAGTRARAGSDEGGTAAAAASADKKERKRFGGTKEPPKRMSMQFIKRKDE